MDDDMIDLMAGETGLRRRLEAYAETRLSPDPSSAARTRARVLAIAHRRADQARATGALTIVPPFDEAAAAIATSSHAADRRSRHGRHGAGRRRVATVLLAAGLAIGAVSGTALAARPGGALYQARLWAETVALPAEASARALAELARLAERLAELDAATASGDSAAAAAALDAYERIVDQASAAAIASEDAVAEAVLETGVGRNVAVLEALVERLPTPAGTAISRAIERTIQHSGRAIDAIDTAKPGRGTDGRGGGPAASSPRPTKAPGPTAKPAKPATEPTARPTPQGGGKPDKPDPTPKRTPPHND